MDKRGYTLVELMIYMVLGLLVVGYSMNAMKQMSRTYVRGREVTKMQQTGRDAISTISRDLMNTGFKYYLMKDTVTSVGTGGDSVVYTFLPTSDSPDSLFLLGSYTSSYNDISSPMPSDSLASFFCWSGDPYDSIEVFRGRLQRSDLIDEIERVMYRVRNDTLYRDQQINTATALNGSGNIQWGAVTTVAILANVKAFQIQYSKDGLNWINDPAITTPPSRDEMRYLRIELLVTSDRSSDVAPSSTPFQLAGGSVTVTPDGEHLYRTYEQVVPIFNNGVIR